jgi:hypothetical protein
MRLPYRGDFLKWHSRITSGAQKLNHKSQDNLSKTYTGRKPHKRASPLLFLSSAFVASFSVRFLPIIGATMSFALSLTVHPQFWAVDAVREQSL